MDKIINDKTTETRILDAAHQVFVRKGFAGARMEDIAKAAGINRALLHYYFRSKEKMFEIIFEKHFVELMGGLGMILGSSDTVECKVKGVVDLYHTKLTFHPDLPLFVIHELSQNSDRLFSIISKMQKGPANLVAKFQAEVKKEVKGGKIKNIDGAQLLINTLALCIYPFIAKPMFKFFLHQDEKMFRKMMVKRKNEVNQFLMDAIKP